MQTIEALEKISRELDPNEKERTAILQIAIDYINQYLNELPEYPGYGYGSFEKLSSMHIEENAKPVEAILDVLSKETIKSVGLKLVF